MGLSHSGTWRRGWTWTPSQGICLGPARAKDRGELVDGAGMPGAGLTVMSAGQARSDRLALKPYWGKPDVRKCVQKEPVKAGVFSGRQTHRGKSQAPRSWTAGCRETEPLKPVDKPSKGWERVIGP